MLLLFHHWRINACTGLDWMDDEYFFQMLIWENFTHVYGANICIVKFNGSSFSSRFEFNQLLVVRKFQKCSSLALRHKALSLFPFFAWLSIHPSIHIYIQYSTRGKKFPYINLLSYSEFLFVASSVRYECVSLCSKLYYYNS